MEQSKRIKSFWAVTIVLVVAIIAAGLVYWFQFQVNYDQDINSLEVRMMAKPHPEKADNTATISKDSTLKVPKK